MASARVLAEMPFVFTTSEYRMRAGIQPSSASRALRVAAAEGAVSNISRGLWHRRDSKAPPAKCIAKHPYAPAWMDANECFMDAVFGPLPRRISHMMALEAAGVPLVTGLQLSLPHGHPKAVMPLGTTLFSEKRERITLHATRLTEHTWMSSPTRAAIETAHHDVAAALWDERIAWAFAEDNGGALDVEEAAEISETLQMRAGLRRLSSIADALRRFTADDPDYSTNTAFDKWAGLMSVRRGDAWIRLHRTMRGSLDPSEAEWVDTERRVLWGQHPEALVASLAT